MKRKRDRGQPAATGQQAQPNPYEYGEDGPYVPAPFVPPDDYDQASGQASGPTTQLPPAAAAAPPIPNPAGQAPPMPATSNPAASSSAASGPAFSGPAAGGAQPIDVRSTVVQPVGAPAAYAPVASPQSGTSSEFPASWGAQPPAGTTQSDVPPHVPAPDSSWAPPGWDQRAFQPPSPVSAPVPAPSPAPNSAPAASPAGEAVPHVPHPGSAPSDNESTENVPAAPWWTVGAQPPIAGSPEANTRFEDQALGQPPSLDPWAIADVRPTSAEPPAGADNTPVPSDQTNPPGLPNSTGTPHRGGLPHQGGLPNHGAQPTHNGQTNHDGQANQHAANAFNPAETNAYNGATWAAQAANPWVNSAATDPVANANADAREEPAESGWSDPTRGWGRPVTPESTAAGTSASAEPVVGSGWAANSAGATEFGNLPAAPAQSPFGATPPDSPFARPSTDSAAGTSAHAPFAGSAQESTYGNASTGTSAPADVPNNYSPASPANSPFAAAPAESANASTLDLSTSSAAPANSPFAAVSSSATWAQPNSAHPNTAHPNTADPMGGANNNAANKKTKNKAAKNKANQNRAAKSKAAKRKTANLNAPGSWATETGAGDNAGAGGTKPKRRPALFWSMTAILTAGVLSVVAASVLVVINGYGAPKATPKSGANPNGAKPSAAGQPSTGPSAGTTPPVPKPTGDAESKGGAAGGRYAGVPISIAATVSSATLTSLSVAGAKPSCDTNPPKNVDASQVKAAGCVWTGRASGDFIPSSRRLDVRAAAYTGGVSGATGYVTTTRGKLKNGKAAPELAANGYLGTSGAEEVAVFSAGNLAVLVKFSDTGGRSAATAAARQQALTVAKEIKAAL